MSEGEVNLFYIAYSEATRLAMPSGYQLLDNIDSTKNDWREYWPIRNFFKNNKLVEDQWYGFFSPRFQEKTGLLAVDVKNFILAGQQNFDVATFSPQPDMGAFFLNIFEQEELFQPGFIQASSDFFTAIGLDLKLQDLIMDSRQIVFSNYFVARPAFWRRWLELNDQLFDICEGAASELQSALTWSTAYPGAVQRKVFLMERIASFILTVEPAWQVKAYNTFDCAWSASRLNQFRDEAVLSDALKIAMKEQGFHHYIEAFGRLREKLR
ncbi:MAG: hypothetical protein Q7T02_03045 [Pseudomonas sp.]|nr:hypothetical protein [Pseudomonas sp.]